MSARRWSAGRIIFLAIGLALVGFGIAQIAPALF
jgi:hypothetical protein